MDLRKFAIQFNFHPFHPFFDSNVKGSFCIGPLQLNAVTQHRHKRKTKGGR
jgi:hypothetical protein